MIVGCYSLDVYCDRMTSEYDHDDIARGTGYANFTGRTATSCLRQAKRAGWSITARRHLCRDCKQKPWRTDEKKRME